jgi:hypothetical protein
MDGNDTRALWYGNLELWAVKILEKYSVIFMLFFSFLYNVKQQYDGRENSNLYLLCFDLNKLTNKSFKLGIWYFVETDIVNKP